MATATIATTTATTATKPTTATVVVSAWARVSAVVVALASCLLPACEYFEPKVPISDVGAVFALADATWFEREQTLFFFYRVNAEQGLSAFSQIEVTWTTDDVEQPFAALSSLTMVHEHRTVSCGPRTICGSASFHVVKPPRAVDMRLRYHTDGELTLAADVSFTTVSLSQPHNDRSAVVYGVFADGNRDVQWRLRHQFPAIRNEEVQSLGLRRRLVISDQGHGTLNRRRLFSGNPYGYAFAAECPTSRYAPLGFADVETSDRAVFTAETMGLDTVTSAEVCAAATVFDPLGPYTMAALARKNPETAPAFPSLRTPVAPTTQIGFFLQTCNAIASEPHRQMQLQRTLLDEGDVVCIDDFDTVDFVGRLARRLQDRVDAVRLAGNDMVLVLGLQRPDRQTAVSIAVEQALALVVDDEQDKSSPRLAGAFVFDSAGYALNDSDVNATTLWCPSTFGGNDLEQVNNTSARSCALQLDNDIVLGPIRLASLPILPTRKQYLTFVDNFSEAQTGKMTSLQFRAPKRTPQSANVPIGDFGTATFFNNEAVTADDDDAFSYCTNDDSGTVVFRVDAALDQVFPLSVLPDLHREAPQGRYDLGLAWDFPYLARFRYDAVTAGAVTVADFTIPFGPAVPAEEFLGGSAWFAESFDLSDVLLRCDRFCTHPTFDNAGVYEVLKPFDSTYLSQCYRPRFPSRSDGGSPLDP